VATAAQLRFNLAASRLLDERAKLRLRPSPHRLIDSARF